MSSYADPVDSLSLTVSSLWCVVFLFQAPWTAASNGCRGNNVAALAVVLDPIYLLAHTKCTTTIPSLTVPRQQSLHAWRKSGIAEIWGLIRV